MTPINVEKQDLAVAVRELTHWWGVDVVFEASGAKGVVSRLFEMLRPAGRVVCIGIPLEPIPFDVAAAQAKEATLEVQRVPPG